MENQAQAVKSTSARAGFIEAIMFFTYAFFAVSWIAGSSLTPQIMEYFKLESFASATFISNAITIAKIIGNFMAAAILAKLYPKRAIMLGSGLIVVGSLIAIFSQQYWMFISAASSWDSAAHCTSYTSARWFSTILRRNSSLR